MSSTNILDNIQEEDGEVDNFVHFSVTPPPESSPPSVDLTVPSDAPASQPNTNSSQPAGRIHQRQPQGRFGGRPQSSYKQPPPLSYISQATCSPKDLAWVRLIHLGCVDIIGLAVLSKTSVHDVLNLRSHSDWPFQVCKNSFKRLSVMFKLDPLANKFWKSFSLNPKDARIGNDEQDQISKVKNLESDKSRYRSERNNAQDEATGYRNDRLEK